MKNLTKQELDLIFNKASKIDGCDPNVWRMDASGAIIKRSSYGRDDEWYGWEVDHIVPRSLLERNGVPEDLINDDRNLRPLNWNNNNSKDDDYPDYWIVVEADEFQERNVSVNKEKTISEKKRKELKELYKDYVQLD